MLPIEDRAISLRCPIRAFCCRGRCLRAETWPRASPDPVAGYGAYKDRHGGPRCDDRLHGRCAYFAWKTTVARTVSFSPGTFAISFRAQPPAIVRSARNL